MAQQSQVAAIDPRVLVQMQFITSEVLTAAAETAQAGGQNVLQVLVAQGRVNAEQLARAHALQSHTPFVPADKIRPTAPVRKMIAHDIARRLKIVPVVVDPDTSRLMVATGALTPHLKEQVETELPGVEVGYLITTPQAISAKIDEYYSRGSEAAELAASRAVVEPINAAPSLDTLLGDGEIARAVRLIIVEGINRGASDIHLEPHRKTLRVRYRVDSILAVDDGAAYDADTARQIINHVKVMAQLDTSERRRPQDGRMPFTYDGRQFDLRIAVVPVKAESDYGKIVMRILASELAGQPLDALGFSPVNLRRLRNALARKDGMVLVTGPTGSGKSTTLYSGINEISNDTNNVMTVEDPVEYQFPGLNQVQVSDNVSFADVLRSFLRADPDIILVGEIRDAETAEIALKAAMTGHLVLSTLHTSSAAGTVSRLTQMNVEPYMIADSLSAVLSQRLVRRLCSRCRQPYEPTDAEVLALGGNPAEGKSGVFHANAAGCEYCQDGYSGRVALHELLAINSALREVIGAGALRQDIESAALKHGRLTTMGVDGWHKARQGLVDVAQVLSVVTVDVDVDD